MTVKGQVTVPKAIRESAGIRPGDRVRVRVRPEGGVIVERDPLPESEPEALAVPRRQIDQAMALYERHHSKPKLTSEAWLRIIRDDK